MNNEPNLVASDAVVSLVYTLTVNDEVIDSADETNPLEFLQGHQNIIPGLEKALEGLAVGQSKEVFIQAQDAYGDYDPQAVSNVPRHQFPPNFPLEIGRSLRVQTGDGRVLGASISSFTSDQVVLDFNHPLAGKNLFFKVKVQDLRAATDEELANGRLGGGCASCSSGKCGSGDCC
jgi:FKBP-type peptidyl-prolyl cis-trans isomerase SlyD